jgi:hypothetical protein
MRQYRPQGKYLQSGWPGSLSRENASYRPRPLPLSNIIFVRPIHATAMPVLLTTEQEFDTCLDGPVNDAIALQRPLPNG